MSSIELVRGYFTERYRAAFFVPLAILLYIAGALTLGVAAPPWRSISGVIAAYALVLAFRIRDDLADREVDRKLHPGRITVAANDLAPLTRIAYGALSLALVLAALSPARYAALSVLGAVTLLLFGWYRLRESVHPSPLLNSAIVLLKYPALAFVAAAAGASAPTARSAGSLVAGLTVIYLVACIYERLHDRGVHA